MIILLDRICKSFRDGEDELMVLKNVSLSINEGEMVAVMGRSGCGKTTLLNILGLLMRPDSGSYTMNGQIVDFSASKRLDDLRRNNLGIIVQNSALIERKTAAENIILPIKDLYKKKQVYDRLDDILQKLGLDRQKHKYPAQLSGGEKQRVSIARAMINNPCIILADEPTGSLDYENAQNVMSILKDIKKKRGTTILLATHDPMIAEQCDYILRINYGELEKTCRKKLR